MKQMIVSALVSLVTGFFLVVGLAGGAFVAKHFLEEKKEASGRFRPFFEFVPLPASAFVEHSRIADVPRFTVRGTIRNDSDETWQYVRIQVDLKVDQTRVNQCSSRGELTLDPKSSQTFLIECNDVAAKELSPNLKYEMSGTKEVETKRMGS